LAPILMFAMFGLIVWLWFRGFPCCYVRVHHDCSAFVTLLAALAVSLFMP